MAVMKIAVWHNLPSGGAKRALVDHVDGLVARGHQVEIWTNPVAAAELPHFSTAPRQHLVDLDIDPRGGALPPWPVARQRLAAMSRHLDVVSAAIDDGGFDVVYGGACRYLRTVDLGHRVSVPTVLYLGEPYRWLYEAMPELVWALPRRGVGESLPAWLRRRVRDVVTIPGLRRQAAAEVHAAHGWTRLLVNSAYSRESVQRAYGIAPRVCYLGVDPARLSGSVRPREHMVLGLGALVPEKGVERTLRAVAALAEPRPPLVWVANVEARPYRAEMERLSRSLGVELDIRLGISDRALGELLATAGFLLYAPQLEPFGFAVLEASAAGLPVVALAEGGVRETVVDGRNGLLVGDETELSSAARRIFADPELAAELSSGGREVAAERWSLSDAVDRIEHQLTDVADGAG